MLYTEKDVIIWSDDARLKDAIGKECWSSLYPMQSLRYANGNEETGILKSVGVDENGDDATPFLVEYDDGLEIYWTCIVVKKSPELEYSPLDLSLEEDRKFIIGRWLEGNDEVKSLSIPTDFYSPDNSEVLVRLNSVPYTSKELLDKFVFHDGPEMGRPVGRLREKQYE